MHDPKTHGIDEDKIYGPFIFTFGDGTERQYNETLRYARYLEIVGPL